MRPIGELILAAVVLLVLAHVVSAVKAIPAGISQEDRPPIIVRTATLADGTIERHYSDGTVRREFFVNAQINMRIGFTTQTSVGHAIVIPPPDPPDTEPANWMSLFLCLGGAGALLRTIRQACPKPKPVERDCNLPCS